LVAVCAMRTLTRITWYKKSKEGNMSVW
jgi:hypothetical protein